jgi:predicted metal-dependent peptidase
MSDNQRIGLIAHEVGHCALGHPWRRKGRDPKLWNIACDHAINLLLLESGFELPDGGLHDDRFEKMTAEQIYRILKDEEDENPGTHTGEPMDSHELWGKSPDQGSGGDDDGDSDDDQQSDDGQGGGAGDGGDDDDAKGGGEITGDNEIEKGFEDLAKEWERAAKEASAACAMAGKLPGRLAHAMDSAKSQLPWNAIMRRWIRRNLGAGYNPDRMDRRWWVSAGVIVEPYGRPSPSCGFAIDTSISMPNKAVRRAFGEGRSVVEGVGGARVRLLMHDTEVAYDKWLRRGEPFPDKAFGRGGTDFRPVFEAFADGKVDMVVLFSDCDGPFPDKAPPYPVLVVRCNSSTPVPSWCKVIDVTVH